MKYGMKFEFQKVKGTTLPKTRCWCQSNHKDKNSVIKHVRKIFYSNMGRVRVLACNLAYMVLRRHLGYVFYLQFSIGSRGVGGRELHFYQDSSTKSQQLEYITTISTLFHQNHQICTNLADQSRSWWLVGLDPSTCWTATFRFVSGHSSHTY